MKQIEKPLNIKNAEAYLLASEIAEHTGKSLTRVVVDALRHERERIVPRKLDIAKVRQILAELHSLPDIDNSSVDEIISDLYDEDGLPR